MRIKILTTPNTDLLIASEPATIPTVFEHSKCLPHYTSKSMHCGTHLSSAPPRASRRILHILLLSGYLINIISKPFGDTSGSHNNNIQLAGGPFESVPTRLKEVQKGLVPSIFAINEVINRGIQDIFLQYECYLGSVKFVAKIQEFSLGAIARAPGNHMSFTYVVGSIQPLPLDIFFVPSHVIATGALGGTCSNGNGVAWHKKLPRDTGYMFKDLFKYF
ncbi:hypothetical protein DFH07DRAFT_783523 [Mycena maculata]|uniref:Uncharacterized protein n=1 Tax=Mycena maculata TaxID=230809 RepID=A0AAD7MLU2_9AGAR|nr:hypothetical protein DFH07DRAFT_783523 [Mycena maculata]